MLPTTPRALEDLPYAPHLAPFAGQLADEGDYDTVLIEGGEYAQARGGGARFIESAFSAVAFAGGRFRGARFHDVWLHTVRWVGADLADTDWLDAEVIASVFAGLDVFGAGLRRVRFFNCKFDSVNVRAATVTDTAFVDCVLRDVDFGGAELTGVTFPGSTLDGVRFAGARMTGVDLRSAASLDIADGHDALRGATITSGQLLDLAPMFALALGVAVQDR